MTREPGDVARSRPVNVAQESLKVFTARFTDTVLSFVALAYFARELGTAELGTFFLFEATLSGLNMASNLGIDTGIEKRISGEEDPGRVLATAALMKLAALVLLGLLIVAFGEPINQYVGADVALFLVLAHALSQANTLFIQGLRGELRVGEVAEIRLVTTILRLGLSGVLVYSGLTVWALIIGLLAGLAISVLWTWWTLETTFGTPSVEQARSLYDYAKFNVVPTLGLEIHNWMDVLIIGWFLTTGAVGVYEVAWRVAGVTTILAGAISATVLPLTSAWQAQRRIEPIEGLVSNALVPSLFLVIPATAGLLVIAPDFLGIVFGREYAVAWLALVILAAGKAPGVIQMIVGKCLLGLDRPDLVARATIVSIVANLAFNVVLIWQFGIVGAAVGTTASLAIGMVIRVRYLRWFLSIRFPIREVGWCVVSSVGMALAIYWLVSVFQIDTLAELFGVVVAGTTSYGLLVLLYRPLREQLIKYAKAAMPLVLSPST